MCGDGQREKWTRKEEGDSSILIHDQEPMHTDDCPKPAWTDRRPCPVDLIILATTGGDKVSAL